MQVGADGGRKDESTAGPREGKVGALVLNRTDQTHPRKQLRLFREAVSDPGTCSGSDSETGNTGGNGDRADGKGREYWREEAELQRHGGAAGSMLRGCGALGGGACGGSFNGPVGWIRSAGRGAADTIP